MDLTIDSRTLSTALQLTSRVASKKATSPMLSCARLFAANGIAYLTSTDLYTSLALPCAASVAIPGDVAFDVTNVVESLKSHKASTPVRLVCEAGTMAISVGGASYKLRTVPAEDMPALPAFRDATAFATVDGPTLARLIGRVSPCVSTDDTRPHLASMLLERGAAVPWLRAVATDGHRLAIDECETITTSADAASILVPRHALDTLSRALKGYKGTVAIDVCDRLVAPASKGVDEVREKHVRFAFADGRAILARVTDSRFPPYTQVIPQRSEHRAVLNRAALLQAVKVAQASASAKTGSIVLTWSDRLTITASDPEKGSASIEVETIGQASGDFTPQINKTTGNDDSGATIGFCAKYIVDALTMHDDTNVELCWSASLDPMTIRDSNGGATLGLTMPMRL